MDRSYHKALIACCFLSSPLVYASGPWNFGPLSSQSFSSAYEACEDLSKNWALQQSVNLDSISVAFNQKQIASPLQASATCSALGSRGTTVFPKAASNLYLSSSYIFDPAKCDLYRADGTCYIKNELFNLGEPIAAQIADCGSKNNGPDLGVGNPINLATGNKFQRELDFSFLGEEVFLRLERNYNSADNKVGPFGIGWSTPFASTMKEVLIYNVKNPSSSDTPAKTLRVIVAPDGRRYEFEKSNARWIPSKNVVAKLELVGNEYHFSYGSRNKLIFNNQGLILRQINSRGLSVFFNYRGSQVESISDDFGNTISFGYRTDGLVDTASIANFGSIKYEYDQQRLTSTTFNGNGSATPIVRTYVYEDPNYNYLLSGIIDENKQRFATWRYDNKKRAISSEHGNGAEKSTIEYTNEYSTKVTNALSKDKVYTLVDIYGVKQILNVTDKKSAHCPQSNQNYTYDGRGFLETITDGEGNVTHYERNDRGLVTNLKRGLGWEDGVGSTLLDRWEAHEIRTEWYEDFDIPKLMTFRGKEFEKPWQDFKRIEYKHDTYGHVTEESVTDLTQITQPYVTAGRNRTTSFIYNYFDNSPVVSTLDVNGPRSPEDISGGQDDTTHYTFNNRGLLSEVRNALGHKKTYSDFNALGAPQKITDENSVVQTLEYDAQNHLNFFKISTAKGVAITDYDFYPSGLLQKVTLPDNSSTAYFYNSARHLTDIVNNFDETITFTPNALHGEWEKREIKNKTGKTVGIQSRQFDELGRIWQITGNDNQQRTYSYNSNDQIIKTEDAGHEQYGTLTTESTPDGLGNIYEVIDAKENTTQYGFDGQSRLTSVTDANNHQTQYVVDGFGEVIREISPDRGTQDYRYDASGNLTEIKDAKSVVFTLKYDALNRIKSRTDTAGGDIKWTYDLTDTEHLLGIGRLSTIGNSVSKTDFSYNELGLITKETTSIQIPNGSPVKASTQYDFDLAGNLTSVTYPSGRVVGHTVIGGRTQSTGTKNPDGTSQGIASSIQSFPFGAPESYRLNSVNYSKKIDLDGRVESIDISDAANKKLLNIAYGYDAFNNVNSLTYANDPQRNKTIGYDQLHRVEDFTSGTLGNSHITYDPVGNRLTRQISGTPASNLTETYNYPWENNRLGSITVSNSNGVGRNYTYDDNGNLRTQKAGSLLTLKHDQNNQLQSSTVTPN